MVKFAEEPGPQLRGMIFQRGERNGLKSPPFREDGWIATGLEIRGGIALMAKFDHGTSFWGRGVAVMVVSIIDVSDAERRWYVHR